MRLSGDPTFGGDATLLNPEQLVVLAAASCQLLSFLAVAARARIDVWNYEDQGEGTMAEDDPPARLTSIVLRPTIWVAPGPSDERVAHLVGVAHRECYVANSLRTDIRVEPTIIFEPRVGESAS
jgi:organic hydroperoxide reductase OsmC/OhrA